MKLNLCCGDDVRDGYINIDVRKTKPNVLILDLEKEILKPFPSNSVEEIIAKDCIEHVSWRRVEDLLRDIHRVLKCDGRVYIQVPDLEAIATKVILNPDFCFGDLCGWKAISYWIYGSQDYLENSHKAGFTIPTLKRLLEQIGFIVEKIQNDGGTNIMCFARKRC
jgi:cyclopropane fatty-acyl-phospholipid synthase-like methyltransferase